MEAAAEKCDVVVVGAGLAGLTAATKLRRHGVAVVVLEARDRVGGRTLHRDGFDLGGEYIGTNHHALIALCAELGFDMTFPGAHGPGTASDLVPTYDRGKTILYLDGKRILQDPDAVLPRGIGPLDLLGLWWTIRRVNSLARAVQPYLERPWDHPRARAWDAQSVEDYLRRAPLTRTGRELFRIAVRSLWSVEPRELSWLYFLSYVAAAGSFETLVDNRPVQDAAQAFRFRHGSQEVSQRLAARLGDAVRLGRAVRRITQDSGGVTITAATGERYEAARVIVALSPLLTGGIAFDPPLPPQRSELVSRSPLGRTIKCIAVYPEPFWRLDDEGRPRYTGLSSGNSTPLVWTMDNTATDGTPALMAFVVGAEADALLRLSTTERARRVAAALAETFADPRLLRPARFIEHCWTTDPWTRGCPTGVLPPNGLTTVGRALRAPVGRIHWSGTETATRWTGYMEGAVQAGLRAAEEVMAYPSTLTSVPTANEA